MVLAASKDQRRFQSGEKRSKGERIMIRSEGKTNAACGKKMSQKINLKKSSSAEQILVLKMIV